MVSSYHTNIQKANVSETLPALQASISIDDVDRLLSGGPVCHLWYISNNNDIINSKVCDSVSLRNRMCMCPLKY